MRAAADLPEEFQDPVGYADRWFWLAVLAVVVVVAYYLAVLWWARRRPEPPPAPPVRVDVGAEQRAHLARLDDLAEEVRAGHVSAREGHQRISEVLRSYVEVATPLRARSMTLTDLRARAPRELVDAVALMYPPEFAPGEEGRAAETFEEALDRARRLVSRWGTRGHAGDSAPAAAPRPGVTGSPGPGGSSPWT